MNRFRLYLPLLGALMTTACSTLPTAETAINPSYSSTEQTVSTPTKPIGPAVVPTGPLQSLTVEAPLKSTPTVAAVEAPSDLWVRMRRGFKMPTLDNAQVRTQEQWYGSRPDYIQRMTERSSKYLFHIVEEVERRNLPQELALLPFIESAFNPQAVSSAKAAGMWQFMPATGRHFDLKQNAFRDDRRDVLASTQAALNYLERLYKMFNDWHLALAAYNWGEGNVMRAIRRNKAAGLGTNYEDLRMPDETRHYVPKLQAVKNIVVNPTNYATTLPLIGNHPFFDSVTVKRDIDVSLIADLANVSEADFRQLNPSHNKPVIMAAGTPTVLLPWDNALLFEERLRLHKGPTASWTAWKVPRNMTAAAAAKQHDMTESELRSVNKIPPRMLLRAGSTVLVPRQGKLDADVPEHIADNGQILLAPESSGKRQVKVKVLKGDNLAKVAKRHKVSVANLRQWNQLANNASLRAGQILLIERTVTAKAKSRTASKTKATRKKTTLASSKTASTAR